MADEKQNETQDGNDGGSKSSGKSFGAFEKILVGVLLLPVILSALFYDRLLRKGKFKPSMVGLIALVSDFVCYAILAFTGAFHKFSETLNDYSTITSHWKNILVPIIVVMWMVGAVLGWFASMWDAHQMSKNPHRVQSKGSWMYHFKYRETPWEKSKIKKLEEKLKSGELVTEESSPLGICIPQEEKEKPRVVSRFWDEAIRHFLITGSTGSGKTITMLSLIRSDILQGRPTFIIDMKRDPDLAAKVAKWSEEAGSEFYHFVNGDKKEYDIPFSKGQAYYDFLKSGSYTAKADMVLSMRTYDKAAEVHRTNMKRLLQVLFGMITFADRSKTKTIDWDHGGVYTLYSAASAAGIQELAIACAGTSIENHARMLLEGIKGKTLLRNALDELAGQMSTIVASEYGQWMKTTGKKTDRNIDLFDLSTQQNTVVLFSLNSDSEREFAKYVGTMIMADLTNVSAQRRNSKIENEVGVYVDEFQTLNPDTVLPLLEKARGSFMATTLAQQSLSQIVSSAEGNGEAYLNGIVDTCGNFIVHAGSGTDSAETYAKILGRTKQETYTKTMDKDNGFFSVNWDNDKTSRVSASQEFEWDLDPKILTSLSSPLPKNSFLSTAVVINKECADPYFKKHNGPLARVVHMIPDNEVLSKPYKGKKYAEDKKAIELDRNGEVAEQENDVDEDPLGLNSLTGSHRAMDTDFFEDTVHDDFDDYDEFGQPIDENFRNSMDGDFVIEDIEEENQDDGISALDLSTIVKNESTSNRSLGTINKDNRDFEKSITRKTSFEKFSQSKKASKSASSSSGNLKKFVSRNEDSDDLPDIM